jgi:integrase
MLAWGRKRGLVPKAVWINCNCIEKLKKGEQGNRPERKHKKRAVPVEQVDAVSKHCHPQIAAMVRLQLATGMRPGDVCSSRWADIDKEGEIDSDGNRNWIYTVGGAKTEHHGFVTQYKLGKEAQAILERFPALPTAFIFSPARAMADRRAAGKQRKLKAGPRRTFNTMWHPVCYRQHVVDACTKAKVQRFTPHELRHKALTEVTNTAGVGAACAVANHRSIATTARYYHVSKEDSSRGVAKLDLMLRKG